MKMRTLTAVGMISALLLTLTACGGSAASSPDAAPSSLSASGAADSSQAAKPYDLFKTAFDKTTAETSIQIAEKLKMTAEAAGIRTETAAEGKIARIESGDSGEMLSDMVTTVLGQESRNITYFKDGFLYVSSGDTQYKRESTWADFLSLSGEDTDMLLSATEKAMKGVTLPEKEGETAISFQLSADRSRGQLESLLADLGADMTADNGFSFTDPEITCVVGRDGYFTEYTAAFSAAGNQPTLDPATGTVIDVAVTLHVEWHLQFEAFGDQVTVTPPENLDAYEDATFRVSDLSAEEIQAIVDLLHDDAGGLVEDFDKIYQELERLYGVEFMRQLTGG